MEDNVPAINAGATIDAGARFMLFWDMDRIEVRDKDTGKKLGTVTEHDIVKLVAKEAVDIVANIEDAIPAAGSTSPGIERLRAQDIMSNPVIAIHRSAPIEEIAELLGDREISGLPVVDDEDTLVGVVSERDLAHAIGSPLIRLVVRRPLRTGPFLRTARPGDGTARTAADVMTSPPISIHPDTPLHTVAEIMLNEEVNRIPIEKDHRLIGIVTRGDVIAAVAGMDHSRDREIHPPVIIGKRKEEAAL